MANSLKVDKEIICFLLLCYLHYVKRQKIYEQLILVGSMASHTQLSTEATNSCHVISVLRIYYYLLPHKAVCHKSLYSIVVMTISSGC